MNAWNEGGGGDPHWANSNLGGMGDTFLTENERR